MWTRLVFASRFPSAHELSLAVFTPMAAVVVLILWAVLGYLISQQKDARRRALLIGFGLALLLAPTDFGDGLDFASADLLMGLMAGEPRIALIAAVSITVATGVLSLIVLLLRKLE